jgi:hypothetical protein
MVPSSLQNVTLYLGPIHICTQSWSKCLRFLFISRRNQVRVSVKDRQVVVFVPMQDSLICIDLGHDGFFLNRLQLLSTVSPNIS